MGPESVPEALARHLPTLEAALQVAIPDDGSPLGTAARYVMGWEDADGNPATPGGKRIRPALCLLAAQALGAEPEGAMPGAVAIELVHNFSLVHDEVQDRDLERHHRPTAWSVYGEAQAINIGDYLYSRAIGALVEAEVDPETRRAALLTLNEAIARMIAGQWADISFEARARVTPEEYVEMVAGKTGAMLAASLRMAAVFAGADAEVAEGIGAWGLQVGLAFQVWDDYLGTWGDPKHTGKSDWADLRRKKKTYPIVLAMEDGRAAEILDGVFAMKEVDERSAREAATAMEAAGAREGTRRAAERYASAAESLLGGLPLGDHERQQLNAIAQYLVRRER